MMVIYSWQAGHQGALMQILGDFRERGNRPKRLFGARPQTPLTWVSPTAAPLPFSWGGAFSKTEKEKDYKPIEISRNDDIINTKRGKLMNEQRIQEYLFLREEVQSNLKTQQTWSTFSIGTVITFLGIAVNIKDQPLLCLLPLIPLLLASFKIRNYRESITKIVAYMIVRCESPDGFFWESSLYELRKAQSGEVTNDCKVNEDKSGDSEKLIGKRGTPKKQVKKYSLREIATKIISVLETQELSFMGLVCLFSYNYLSHIAETINRNEVILCNIVSVIVLMLTVNASKNYWNISPKLIDEYKERWRKSIISAKNEATKKEL